MRWMVGILIALVACGRRPSVDDTKPRASALPGAENPQAIQPVGDACARACAHRRECVPGAADEKGCAEDCRTLEMPAPDVESYAKGACSEAVKREADFLLMRGCLHSCAHAIECKVALESAPCLAGCIQDVQAGKMSVAELGIVTSKDCETIRKAFDISKMPKVTPSGGACLPAGAQCNPAAVRCCMSAPVCCQSRHPTICTTIGNCH